MGLTIQMRFLSRVQTAGRAEELLGRAREVATALPFAFVGPLQRYEGDALGSFSQYVDVPWIKQRGRVNGEVKNGRSQFVEVRPLEAFAFMVSPGEGCEDFHVGLARYPRSIPFPYRPSEDKAFIRFKAFADGSSDFQFQYDRWEAHCRALWGAYRSPYDATTRELDTGLRGWQMRDCCKTEYAADPRHGGLENFLRCHIAVVNLLDRLGQFKGLTVEYDDEGEYGRHTINEEWHDGTYDTGRLAILVGQSAEAIAAIVGKFKDAYGPLVVAPILHRPDFEHLEARGRRAAGRG